MNRYDSEKKDQTKKKQKISLDKLNLHQNSIKDSMLCESSVPQNKALDGVMYEEVHHGQMGKITWGEKHWQGNKTGMCFEFYHESHAE